MKKTDKEIDEILKSNTVRRLFIDIETSPNIVYSWSTGYKLNIGYENIIKERAIICVSYKFQGDKTVSHLVWKRGNDKNLVKEIFKVIREADEIIAHNGARFDLPWLKTRALLYGVNHETHAKMVDTLSIARKHYYFNSNRLDYLSQILLGEHKLSHDGFKMWTDVMDGNKAQLKKMVEYCDKDVLLLERVYRKLAPHVEASTHMGVAGAQPRWTCPQCGSEDVIKEKVITTGKGMRKHQMGCKTCKKSYTVSNAVFNKYLDRFEDERNDKPEKKRVRL
jgi:transcription elongation factor Elf1